MFEVKHVYIDGHDYVESKDYDKVVRDLEIARASVENLRGCCDRLECELDRAKNKISELKDAHEGFVETICNQKKMIELEHAKCVKMMDENKDLRARIQELEKKIAIKKPEEIKMVWNVHEAENWEPAGHNDPKGEPGECCLDYYHDRDEAKELKKKLLAEKEKTEKAVKFAIALMAISDWLNGKDD